MTDRTPPPDLIDAIAMDGDPIGWGRLTGTDREIERGRVGRSLDFLAEWADGALIDPQTWQRIDVKRVDDSRPHRFPRSAIHEDVIAWECIACHEWINERDYAANPKRNKCSVDWRTPTFHLTPRGAV